MRALGGGSRSPVWKRIEADVLGLSVATMRQPDAGTLGAAMLAGVGIGSWPDVATAAAAVVEAGRIFTPNPDHRDVYDERYATCVAGYESLTPVFPNLPGL